MSIRRFFVEEIKGAIGGSCVIAGSEARHILKVLRMGRGDAFVLMDRAGNRYSAIIESVKGEEVVVKLEERLPVPESPVLEITLCQAVLKSSHMDYLIEKTSELGVRRVLPFTSERTVVKIDASANKVRRWADIAISAAKQSNRGVPADVTPPVSFHDMLKQYKDADCLKTILWEREDSRDLKELMRPSAPGMHFIGMVGPEGGFSPDEVSEAVDSGFIPVSLGRRILRAETAAITLVAVVQYEWGDLSLKGDL